MKVLKNIMFFLLGFVFMLGFTDSVYAADPLGLVVGGYNGSSTGTGHTSGTCVDNFTSGKLFCRFRLNSSQNSNYRRGIRISFIYYDGSSHQQIGRSIDIWPEDLVPGFTIKSTGLYNNNKINGGPLNYSSMQSPYYFYKWNALKGNLNSSFLKSKFLNRNVLDYYAKEMTGCNFDDPNCDVWNKPSEAAVLTGDGDISKKGYRLFIEPITAYATNNRNPWAAQAFGGSAGEYFILTPTELARYMAAYSWLGATPLNYYLNEEEILFTDYDDVGIKRVRSSGKCLTVGCNTAIMSDRTIGHALQIIDFTQFLNQECDYETGKGFPTTEEDRKDENKMKCCEEHLKEIIDETLGDGTTEEDTKNCMKTSKTTAEFATCMGSVVFSKFGGDSPNKVLEQKLNEFYTKYPYCKGDCEEEIKKMITDPYEECKKTLTAAEKLKSNMAEGSNCKIYTKCEVQLVTNANQFINSFKDCIYSNALLECDYENPDGSDDDDDDEDNPTPICNENNPNHFPSSPNDTKNRECCEYFEEKIKKEAIEEATKQGKTPEQAKAYAEQKAKEWIEATEYRKNCLKGNCDINSAILTEACCEELMADPLYKNKPDSFWEAKGCPVDEKDKEECSYNDYAVQELDRAMSGDCKTDSDLVIKDSTDWDCIFESPNVSRNSDVGMFKDYYVVYSNPVCAIYCREDVIYDLPDGSMVVNAGHHFTVKGDGSRVGSAPNWAPIKFTSKRECRTGPSASGGSSGEKGTEYVIPWEEYNESWKPDNEGIMDSWDSTNINYHLGYSIPIDSYDTYCCAHWETGTACSCWSDENGGGGCDCWTYEYCAAPSSFTTSYTVEPYDYYTWRGELNQLSHPSWISSSPGSGDCPASQPDPRIPYQRLPEYKRTWKNLRESMDRFEQYQEDFKSCTEWDNFYTLCNGGTCGGRELTFSQSNTNVNATRYAKYTTYDEFLKYFEFSPDLSIEYNEPTNGEYSYNDLLLKSEPNYQYSKNAGGGTTKVDKFINCNERSACSHGQSYYLYLNSSVSMTLTKMYTYELEPNVFDTIMKPQGVAIHSANKSNDGKQEYVDLGYSALHVHYMTASGRYPIALTYPKFTPDAEYNDEMPASNIVHNYDQFVTESPLIQECTYKVENIVIENEDPSCVDDNCTVCESDACDPLGLKGINVLYRPISLSNPFPGVSGAGRNPGSNWEGDVAERFITNNRGVKEDRVYYDKEPMYEITLTPAIIKEIRKYNDTTMYSDYNLDCINGAGTECKSDFIRGDLDYSDYDFSKLFSGCGTGNWDDCDNEDGISR